MKGEFTIRILKALSETALDAADLFEAFLQSGYGASVGRIDYNRRLIRKRRSTADRENMEYNRLRRRYLNLVAWLRNDELIFEEKKSGKRIFKISRQGLQKLKALLRRKETMLPVVEYKTVKTDNFTIVAFDVVEKEKRKRHWLRSALKRMGFKKLQKSVWVGRIKIPREFLDDLSGLRLVEMVEILETTKTGSLRHIV